MKQRSIIILALLAVLTLTAQTAMAQDAMSDWHEVVTNRMDTVTICFELQSKASGEEATVVWPDHLEGEQKHSKPVTDKDGRWTVKIPTFRTLHIQIWDDNKIHGVVWGTINLFCHPGETAYIRLDDVNNHLEVSGSNAQLINDAMSHPLKLKDFHGRMFGMEMNDAANRIRSIYEQNIHNIDTLWQRHPDLSQCYTESLLARARYSYAMDMTQNIIGHVMDSLPTMIERGNTLSATYLALLEEVETDELLHPKGPLPIDALQFFSDLCALHTMKDGIVRETEESEDELLQALKWNFNAIETIPCDDQIKQQLKIAKILDTILTSAMMDNIAKQVSDTSLLQMAKDRMGEKEAILYESITKQEETELESIPIDSLEDGREIFQKLIAPYRDHVIYIDVWGTWCGPCREEMTHMPALHEKLRGMDVIYMTFANNSPQELWQKALAHYHIDGSDHVNFNLPKQQQNAIEDHLGIEGFPTYILVAPDGSIAIPNAPRPSQPQDVWNAIRKIKDSTNQTDK